MSEGSFPWKVKEFLTTVTTAAQPSDGSMKSRTPRLEKGIEGEPDLVSETNQVPVVEVPKGVIDRRLSSHSLQDNDWEVLSEKASNGSVGGCGIFVTHAGSVRSITSIDQDTSSSHTTLSIPFKIQRTASSSTIDSQEITLGPSGKGILGVDYVEHIVMPTDTLQGICISYKVSASNLRRANHFTGHSLHSAPKKLLIPLSKQALRTGFIRVQDTDSKEYKLHKIRAEQPGLSLTEARTYLEFADWDIKEALESVKADQEWEKEEAVDDGDLKAGQIGIRVKFSGGKASLDMKGAGRSPKKPTKRQEKDIKLKEEIKPKQKVVIHSKLPAIATKSVLAEDLYKAAPEHNSFGFELKDLSKRN